MIKFAKIVLILTVATLGLLCDRAIAADKSTAAGKPFDKAQGRPNVIIFLVDDMGWMDTTVNGSKYYETPSMERLARKAMKFTSAYTTPLCSPSRACILTGKASLHHGITTPAGHVEPKKREIADKAPPNKPFIYPHTQTYLEPSEYTLAEALRDAGYRTAHLGKWHLGLTQPYWPEQQGFDVAFHAEPSAGPASYFSPYGVIPTGTPGGKTHVGTITDGPPGEYIADRLTDEAIKFIESSKDKPFFLNFWHYNVHGPWGFKTNYAEAFMGKKDPLGKQGNPIMASMLKSMDESLGRLMDKLDELKIADNTIIIFFSDNGGNDFSNVADPEQLKKEEKKPPTSELRKAWRKFAGNLPPTNNDPLRAGKGTIYEGGIRVPMMVAWPGVVKPGSTSDALVQGSDFYPTVLDAVGVVPDPKQKFDGISLVPVLKQTGPLAREGIFTYFPHKLFGIPEGVSVHSGDWKLIRWWETNDAHPNLHELYNLKDDIGEKKNLADQMPDKVKQLDALIDGFLATGEVVPKPNPAYRPASGGAKAVDLFQGWKPQNCKAVVTNGMMRIEADGKMPFLGVTQLEHTGPVTLSLRAKSAGGKVRVQWRTSDQKTFPTGQDADLALPESADGVEASVELPVKGSLLHLRLYLPVQKQAMEMDWIQLKSAKGKPQRWDF